MTSCFELTVITGSRQPDRKMRNAIRKAAAPHSLRVSKANIAKSVAIAVAAVPGVESVSIDKVTTTHVGVYRVPTRERSKVNPKVSAYRRA